MEFSALRRRLNEVRLRWLAIGASSAVLWGLLTAALVVMAGVWLDLAWELSPELRLATIAAASVAAIALVALLLWRTVLAAQHSLLARRLDRAAGVGGDILTGWDLGHGLSRGAAPRVDSPNPTRDMARLAVAHAAKIAQKVPAKRAISARPLARSAASLSVFASLVALIVVFLPGFSQIAWTRFSDPFADTPPFARTEFEVEPGDAQVRYGDGLDIFARPIGAPVEQLELIIQPNGPNAVPEKLPMFPEGDGRWRAVLAKVTANADYYIRAHRARSSKYHIEVLTLPEIENVDARIVPPAYTGDAAYTGPVPQSGIAGLVGTKVQLRVTSNRPLSGGRIELNEGLLTSVPMKPVASGASEAVGEFELHAAGKLALHVTDVAGQRSRESFATTLTLLTDERPFVRITQPREASLATPTANLPVELAAEDDYGVSRLQLFRSLNDSRPLPMDVRVPTKPPRRIGEKVFLPLARYGLQAGDVIKLFARVEDNDPAGAKGTESTVVTVRIISQEEFERMVRVRQGLEVLLSKYNQARRRMETLAREMDALSKQDAAKDPEAKLAEARREQSQELERRLREEAAAIRKAAAHMLPYDVDPALSDQLAEAAKSLEEMASELEELKKRPDATEKDLQKLLKKLSERLAASRQQFDEKASQPLEHLGKIFPLIADQQRYLEIAARQRDLAQRLATVKGRDVVDDPATKARLRDLEAEQHRLRDDLAQLLGDIENHASALPEDDRLEKLRTTALKFASAVRQSGTDAAMAEAEGAMTEFAGTRAHAKAQEAADILARFISQCEGVGQGAGECLAFQPSLSQGLGSTVDQLLAEMGLGRGSGGSGFGTGGSGYSAQRGPGVGLYGSMPTMGGADQSGGGFGDNTRPSPAGGGTARPAGEQPTVADMPSQSAAGGAAQIAVPPRYRKRVGQYFQRVAEEIGDQPQPRGGASR